MLHAKIIIANGIFLRDLKRIDPCKLGAPAKPFLEKSQFFARPFCPGLHIPGNGIPHPAAQPQALGFPDGRIPEAHPLDPAFDQGVKSGWFFALFSAIFHNDTLKKYTRFDFFPQHKQSCARYRFFLTNILANLPLAVQASQSLHKGFCLSLLSAYLSASIVFCHFLSNIDNHPKLHR